MSRIARALGTSGRGDATRAKAHYLKMNTAWAPVDFWTAVRRGWRGRAVVLPAKVQGEGAAAEMVAMLAQALAERGIASVRYDKRGVAASARAATSEEDLRFEMYADDAAAWVRKFRTDKRFSTIIIAGHSEGAMLGILATQRAPADGYISIAGIARPADAVLHDQLAAGLPKPVADQADAILASLAVGKTVPVPREMPLSAVFRASVQPYMISWFKWDPAAELAKVKVPVLILQGTTDIQVAVAEADSLQKAAPTATLVKVEGMNHVLKGVVGDQATQLRSYSDPALPLVGTVVDAIAKFVKAIRAP